MQYLADEQRYSKMEYRRCGNSGLKLPAVSLGLWHNFGHIDSLDNARNILRLAFDNGITHFDLANNYGPPAGSAEENFGKIYKDDFIPYRDELIISTKAGWGMWPGPYGDWGSKKYLVASLDQSLKRMGLDYVDIFYHHRPDPETPLEETMATLDLMVRQGKALYVGISSYQPAEAAKAIAILKQLGTPCLIHQPKYSMFDRWIEDGLLDILEETQVGCIPFSPLAQGQYNKVAMDSAYIVSLTSQWKGIRLSDGRPFVSDDLLERLKKVVLTHAWGGLRKNKFNNQFQGSWKMINSDTNTFMTGRAVTAQYMPQRPDFGDLIRKVGLAEGHGEKAQSNVWPIEMLRDGDVYVADGFAKFNEGTLIGDRLANSIYTKSKRGVIFWGTVRNIQEIKKVKGFNGWILGDHPSAINEVMLTSINAPIRVGDVTVLPGDVVFASPYGTLFLPAYLVGGIVLEAEVSNLRHIYGIMRNRAGDWTTGQIDSDYSPQMNKEFHDYLRSLPDNKLPMPRKELNDYLETRK